MVMHRAAVDAQRASFWTREAATDQSRRPLLGSVQRVAREGNDPRCTGPFKSEYA